MRCIVDWNELFFRIDVKFAVKLRKTLRKSERTSRGIWLISKSIHTFAWIAIGVLQKSKHWMFTINIIMELVSVDKMQFVLILFPIFFMVFSLFFFSNLDESNGKAKQNEYKLADFFTMRCDMCDEGTFSSFQGAKEHYSQSHGIIGYLVCCDKKFVKAKTVDDHFQWHINPEVHK